MTAGRRTESETAIRREAANVAAWAVAQAEAESEESKAAREADRTAKRQEDAAEFARRGTLGRSDVPPEIFGWAPMTVDAAEATPGTANGHGNGSANGHGHGGANGAPAAPALVLPALGEAVGPAVETTSVQPTSSDEPLVLQPAPDPIAVMTAEVQAMEALEGETATALIERKKAEWSRRAEEIEDARKYAETLKRKRQSRRADQELAAELREPLRRMTLSQFMAAPQPEWLVPQMLYRDGIAVVFGPEGSAKSFLCLDIALSRATGTPWRGTDIGCGPVFYVMAEGQSTNTLRTHAWFLRHPEADAAAAEESFIAYPMPIELTEAGVVDLLADVERDQPDLIIFDTKNLMYVGKESAGEDAGAMLRVLHRIREAAGRCCVVLVDHTGLFDDSRSRGGNGQRAGTETEIRVIENDGMREVYVSRDKTGPFDSSKVMWAFRLDQVPEVPREQGIAAPAVCVPVSLDDLGGATAFEGSDRDRFWWKADVPVPEDVAAIRGKNAAPVADIYRLLAHTEDEDGLSFAEIKRYLAEGPATHGESTVKGALARLRKAEIVELGTTNSKYRLCPI